MHYCHTLSRNIGTTASFQTRKNCTTRGLVQNHDCTSTRSLCCQNDSLFTALEHDAEERFCTFRLCTLFNTIRNRNDPKRDNRNRTAHRARGTHTHHILTSQNENRSSPAATTFSSTDPGAPHHLSSSARAADTGPCHATPSSSRQNWLPQPKMFPTNRCDNCISSAGNEKDIEIAVNAVEDAV